MCAAPDTNCHFGSVTEWCAVCGVHFHHKCAPLLHRIVALDPSRSSTVLWCVRCVYFHHKCAPLPHRIAALDPSRSSMVLRCVHGAHFQLPWLSLAAPGLLAAAPGCSWLLLAASGCSWLSLAVVNVNSRSKENNLFGVLCWDHSNVIFDAKMSHLSHLVLRVAAANWTHCVDSLIESW
jgi:hypothetical protein